MCALKPPSWPPFATSPVAMSPASTPTGSPPPVVLRELCPTAGGCLPASQPRDCRTHEVTIPYLCPNLPSSIDFPFAQRTLLPSRAGSDLLSPSDRKEIKNKQTELHVQTSPAVFLPPHVKKTKDPCIPAFLEISLQGPSGGHLRVLRDQRATHTERKEACLTPRGLFGWSDGHQTEVPQVSNPNRLMTTVLIGPVHRRRYASTPSCP